MVTRRRRRWSLLSAFYVVATLGLMIGGSLWLDARGEAVLATVSGKTEQVRFSFTPQGSWDRFYRVGVTFPTADERSGTATVEVPPALFDALGPGDTLRIRHLAAFPMFARLADRSTASVFRDLGARVLSDSELAPLLLWFGGGFVVLWIASHVSTAVVFGVGLAWIAAAFPVFFSTPSPVALPEGETRARVVAISLVDRAPERRGTRRSRGLRGSADTFMRLAVPYHVVQLQVPLAGRLDSVLAVDAVDSGSAVGLELGAVLPVRYEADSPREARLTLGSRTFRERNRYHYLIPIIGGGLLGMLGAWGVRARRVSSRRSRSGQVRG